MASDDGRDIIFAGIGFLAGLGMFWAGFNTFQLKRLIENTPTSKVRSIAMGFCEVYGKIEPFQKTFTAPLSGKKCVWYDFKVEEERGSGKHRHWVTLRAGRDEAPFYVRDETGAVLVDPKGADADFENDVSGGLGKNTPETVLGFLKENKITYSHGGVFGIGAGFLPIRFRERCIEPGNALYVMGTAGDNPFVEEGIAKQGFEDVMIAKGRHPFYIADKPEKQLVKSMTWGSLGGVVGGALLSIVCLAYLLFRFGLF